MKSWLRYGAALAALGVAVAALIVLLQGDQCSATLSLSGRLWFVTPRSLVFACLVAAALLAASIRAVGVAKLAEAIGVRTQGSAARPGVTLLWCAALFLTVFAAKLVLMREYPLRVPFWDQWDGEGRFLYLPLSTCTLDWGQMFSLHNEHRVFFTRLLALNLLLGNGQWDPRLQQVINAALHALTGVLLVLVLWTANERRRLDFLVFVVALAFALPFGWENTLIGFQSAFYFLLLFSVLGVGLTTAYPLGSRGWHLGLMCVLCGLFSAAGGLAAPVVIVFITIARLAAEPRNWRKAAIALGALAITFTVALATMSPPVPYHAPLKARSVAEFLAALAGHLAWPWTDHPTMSALMWFPMGVLLVDVVRRSVKTTAFDRLVMGLGIWVFLQAAAIAYGRGAGRPITGSRYQDFVSLGFVLNAIALVVVVDRARPGSLARRVWLSALVCWLLVVCAGLHQLVGRSMDDLSTFERRWAAQTASVRQFVRTGAFTQPSSKEPPDLPYPDPEGLIGLLQQPTILRILPRAVRAPVPVASRVLADPGFIADGLAPSTPRDPSARAWGSYTPQGVVARGRFESLPLPSCRGGYLSFDVAGDFALRRQYLAVKDLRSGDERQVRPVRVPSAGWTSVRVACPDGPYSIVAVDPRYDGWFGFREPVEDGRLAPIVEWLIAEGPELLVVALAMILLLARLT